MPILSNPKHELFAQGLAKGKTADEAYKLAGYAASRSNAAVLRTNQNILDRVSELQGLAAKRTLVTIESLTEELDTVRSNAASVNQHSVVLGAIMGKAKLHGLLVDKKEHTGKGGGPIQTLDLSKVSDEQLDALLTVLGPLAGGTGDDDEGDTSGTSEA